MAPTAAFLLLLALTSDPFWFHQNDIIWTPNAPLLTFLWPILVIAACSHILYAGNTHSNHIIALLLGEQKRKEEEEAAARKKAEFKKT